MFDYAHFESLPLGEERLRYLKKCIFAADRAKNYKNALALRFQYIQESVFNDDNFKAQIMFPEYMALFNSHPDEHDPLSFMTAFKWIIEDLADFYQISAEKAEEYFEKFKEYCIKFGYSMRTYYLKKITYYSIADFEKIHDLIKLFRQSERDDLSDCNACEMNVDIQTELEFGSEEKAVKMLTNMIQRNISCAEVPQTTYGKCVQRFTKIGDLEEAEHYADLLMPMIKNNNNFLMEISHILLLKSYTSPNEAYSIFCKYLEVFLKTKNPKMKFHFANAAAKFFENINKTENEEITMKLPRTFELYNEDNFYDANEMSEYFRDIASDIARKFDDRNGNTYYTDILDYEYPSEPIKELTLPAHGTVDRVPFSVAVPFISDESVPSSEKMTALLKTVPDIEFSDISAKESDNMVIYGYNDYIETDFICRITISETDDLDDYHPIHPIKNEDLKKLASQYRTMAVISTIFHRGSENAEMTALLQFAAAINTDHSPAILCVTNGTMFSSEWVDFHTAGRLPLFDRYMYSVHAYPSAADETHFDVVTSGLSQQGSRDITVMNVEEEDLEFIHKVLSQIADMICGFTELRDEGCTTGFGVVYNEESEVHFSWIPTEKAYPDSFSEGDNDLAVPILYLSSDDAENGKGIFVNDIPQDIREKIDFRSSLKYLRIEAALAKRNLPYAFEAMETNGNSELLIGCRIEFEDEYKDFVTDDICIAAQSLDGDTFTGEIVAGIDSVSEFQTGKTITLSIDDIIFWRLEIDGRYYSADDTYLIV